VAIGSRLRRSALAHQRGARSARHRRSVPRGRAADTDPGFRPDPVGHQRHSYRHNYGLGLWQNHIERVLAGWVDVLGVPI
jgi:hypothetical protein